MKTILGSLFALVSGRAAGPVRWLCAVLMLGGSCAAHAQLQGAGSSLVRDLIGSWGAKHGNLVGGVNYEPVGSSAGINRVKEQQIDFGVSDVPLTGTELRQAGLQQLPLVGTAVVVVVNLPEIAGKPIKLDGAILADIYSGVITRWNHAQVAAMNPALKLPDRAIVPLWRADGSGQSYIFTTYLSRASTPWRRTVSRTQNLSLSVGTGVKGGKALLEAVRSTPGALGYEGLEAARKSGMLIAQLQNAAGTFVMPSNASVADALGAARWSEDGAADLDGAPGAGTYPMTAVSYALFPQPARTGRPNPLSFLQAAVTKGDAEVQQAGFVPVPAGAKAWVAARR